MSVDLKTFIKRALAEKRNIEIGKFNLLNLDEIRDSAGDEWPKLKKRIFEAGAHFIEKRLGEDDAVITCNEGFILLFANPDIDIAGEVAAIAGEMKAFFLGQPDFARLKLGVERITADAQGLGAIVAAAVPQAAPPRSRDTKTIHPDTPKAASAHKGLRPYFRPIWDAEKQAFAANFCFSKVNIEGRWTEFRRARQLRMTHLPHAEADCAALDAAVRYLRTSMQKKQRQTFALAVHPDTLNDRDAFARWSEVLTPLPAAVRKKFWIRVDELPEAPKDAAPYLAKIAALGVTLIAERPFGENDLEGFEGMGISLFSMVTRPPSNAESEGLLDHELKGLNQFAKDARLVEARTFLDDIREARTFKDVMATGIRFLGGVNVLKDAPAPSPLRPFSVVDLARLANAA